MKLTRKVGQVAMAGAIAFGGLGLGAIADVPVPGLQANKADAAIGYKRIDVYNYEPNKINHVFELGDSTNKDHTYGEAKWYIKNLNGTIKLSGTTTVNGFTFQVSPGVTGWWTHTVSTDMSNLPNATYELLYIYKDGGIEHRTSIFMQKSAGGYIDTH